MNIKVNRETKLDYDKILDGIVWVFAIGNENHTGKFKQICYSNYEKGIPKRICRWGRGCGFTSNGIKIP